MAFRGNNLNDQFDNDLTVLGTINAKKINGEVTDPTKVSYSNADKNQISLSGTSAGITIYDSVNTQAYFRLGRNTNEKFNVTVNNSNLLMDYAQDLDEGNSHMWEFDFSGSQTMSLAYYSFRINNTEELKINQTTIDAKTNDITTTGGMTAGSYSVGASAGASGTFTAGSGETVTVVNGIITFITSTTFLILLETGDKILMENGDNIQNG